MGKTRDQLEKDIQATVKLVLTEMETLAAMDPTKASEPYGFEERRRRVIRKLWTTFKECLSYERV